MSCFEIECLIEDDEGYEYAVKAQMYYQPEEPMTRDYPGCPAEVSVESVVMRFNGNWVDIDPTKAQVRSIIKEAEEQARAQQCEGVA